MADFGRPRTTAPSGPRGTGIRIFAPEPGVARRYEIRRVLSNDTAGPLFQALDRERGVEVALRILRGADVSQSLFEKLREEAGIAASIDDRRLLKLLDVLRVGQALVLSSELPAGESLRERIGKGPLPVEEALAITTDLLSVLKALHQRGLVHGSLRPAIVHLTLEGTAQVAGIGLLDTFEGAYAAPETALGEAAGEEGDLFSVGAILFEMLAAELPAPRTRPGAQLSRLRPEVPRWLAGVVARLLSQAPDERYPSAEAALADLASRRFHAARKGPAPGVLPFAAALVVALGIGIALYLEGPVVSRFVIDGTGTTALRSDETVLWTRPDLVSAELADFVEGHGLHHGREIAAMLHGPARHVLSFLDERTGRVLHRATLPDGATLFGGVSAFRPVRVQAVELSGESRGQVLVTYRDAHGGASYTVLHDPATDRSFVLFASREPYLFSGFGDVDDDGAKELLFAGRNEALGGYLGVAAVRDPREARHGTRESESAPGLLPSAPAAGFSWYALVSGAPEGAVRFDAPRRAMAAGKLLFDSAGFPRSSRAGSGNVALSFAERLALRRRAYESLAAGAAASGAAVGGGAAVDRFREAHELASLAEDRVLVESAGRLLARALVATDPAAGEALFGSLLPSPNESLIAVDAAEALHVAGYLRRAALFYQKGLEAAGEERAKVRLLQGLVLSLVELGEVERAADEIDRFDAAHPSAALDARMLRAYVAWRRGEKPELVPLPDEAPPLYRYWSLEVRLARGEKPEHLLPSVERALPALVSLADAPLSLRNELLRASGRPPEPLVLHPPRDVAARAHRALVERRFNRPAAPPATSGTSRRASAPPSPAIGAASRVTATRPSTRSRGIPGTRSASPADRPPGESE